MKAIIDGLRYDTETATLIGETSSGEYRTEFDYWEAGLYRTKQGRHFLAGQGGPRSLFAEPFEQGYQSGEGIRPLSQSEALEFAERHLSKGEIETHFGDRITDA